MPLDFLDRGDSPLRSAAFQGALVRPRGPSALGEYRDGGEPRVLEVITRARDLGSLSDELSQQADGWAETYHLSADRANILRGLDLRPEDRVLEVGCGCGAVTRYLGERCGLVDAIEPDARRAEVAAARTRDLSSTQIHAVGIDEVPELPFYDVAIVVGVLEYVGLGAADLSPYIEFLAKIRSRLAQGGIAIVAIENMLGVKYLCGSPEDHTGRPFDGLTGYRHGSIARTFSRTKLASMFEQAGFAPDFFHVFPDYKMMKVAFADRAFSSSHRWLLEELPHFPSPDRVGGTDRTADEATAWRELVRNGEADRFANSFLIIGSTPGAESRWPSDRLAAIYSLDRAARFRTETLVEDGDGRVAFVRRRLSALEPRAGTLVQEVAGSVALGGDRLDLALEQVPWHEAVRLLGSWRRTVEASPGCVDMIPRNLRVTEAGFKSFDQEWADEGYGPHEVLGRGTLYLLDRLRLRLLGGRPDLRDAPARDLLIAMGELVGLESDGSWIDPTIDLEARLQATVATGTVQGEAWRARYDAVASALIRDLPHPVPVQPRSIWLRGLGRVRLAFRVLIRGMQ